MSGCLEISLESGRNNMTSIRRKDTDENGNPTPHKYYVTGDDRIKPTTGLPSCTTLASHVDGSSADGLMGWALNLYQDTGNRLEYKESNERAIAIGKSLHAEIHEYVGTGQTPNKASDLFGSWFSTVNEHGVDFLASEMLVYNGRLMYGGTIDAIGMVDGVPTLFDWKTTDEYRLERDSNGRLTGNQKSKRFDQDVKYAAQIGGYMSALQEMGKREKTLIPTQAYILYVFKDTLKTKWVQVNVNKAVDVFEESAKLHKMMLGPKKGGLYAV